jgi:shikimate kinase
MEHIFLIGFMGCGKTHWGQKLSEKLAMPFVDMDALIAEKEQMSVAEYFETQGEAIFREIERFHLHGLAKHPPAVVAVGGGTPCFFDNLDWINRHGKSVYLRTDPAVLARRLQGETDKRPLIKGLSTAALYERIFTMLLWREPFYMNAKHVIEMPSNDGDLSLFNHLSLTTQAHHD